MINIGSVTKPNLSDSPVKSKRAIRDGELVIPAGIIDPQAKTPSKSKQKHKRKDEPKESSRDLSTHDEQLSQQEQAELSSESPNSGDETYHSDGSYDDQYLQSHQSHLDIEA